jgi:hypothetical protein
MRESLLSKMASVHSTLAGTPSKTVAPLTEAYTDFDILLCIGGWCVMWLLHRQWWLLLSRNHDTLVSCLGCIPSGWDVLMVWAPIKEKVTGIMCNGMNLVGMYFYSFRSMPLAHTWIQLQWVASRISQLKCLKRSCLFHFSKNDLHCHELCLINQ